jgi:sugar lactone lactonase YvrE
MMTSWSIVVCLAILLGLRSDCSNCSQNASGVPQESAKDIPPATASEIRTLEGILRSDPDNPAALFDLALDEATIGESEKAIGLLERMAQAHTGMDPKYPEGRPFKSLASDPRFVALVANIERENQPIVRSKPAFVLKERDLAPEGIAYDPGGRKFYVSSVSKHKIISVDSRGLVKDFKAPGQDGLGSTLGMKVDAKRRFLWVVSVPSPDGGAAMPWVTGATTQGTQRSSVFQYDLETGRLRFKHQLPPGSGGFLNDVALTATGDAFTTNSGTGEVFRMSPDRDGMELFLPANSVPQANGIAVSSDDKVLFVAGWLGVVRVDLATKELQMLAHARSISDANLDGMYFYKGSLIGIQNGVHPGRVMRYPLNPLMNTITRAEVLEAYNPLFETPTTATMVGDLLYFVANPQMDKLTDSGTMPPPDQLREPHVVKLKL